MDKEQFRFQLDKNMVILNSFERDWNHITQICQQIGKPQSVGCSL